MNAGIYEIVNTKNGNRYIGSAVSFSSRWNKHRSELRRNSHRNVKLQRAWNKYGEGSFESRKMLICAPCNLLMYEQRCLDAMKPEYNLFPSAGSALGWRHTAESKAKIGAVHKGSHKSPEAKAKISAAKIGKKLTPEHRAKLSLKRHSAETKALISASMKGRITSPETRAKLSLSLTGLKRSEEERARMSLRAIGKKASAETRAKLSLLRVGIPRSPETCSKMSTALKGRVFSDEWRAKLKAAWERRGGMSEKQAANLARVCASNTGKPGRIPGKQERAKIAAALRGRTLSAEHRANIAAGLARRSQ